MAVAICLLPLDGLHPQLKISLDFAHYTLLPFHTEHTVGILLAFHSEHTVEILLAFHTEHTVEILLAFRTEHTVETTGQTWDPPTDAGHSACSINMKILENGTEWQCSLQHF